MKTTYLNQVCPLKKKTPDGSIAIKSNEFLKHMKQLEPYVQFSSSRESFAKLGTMNFHYKEGGKPFLNKYQVEELRKSGARFHTMRSKNDMVFEAKQHGVQKANKDLRSVHGGLIRTIGSKAGNYDDKFSPDGFFLYDSPCDPGGMLKFRWIQFLKQKYEIPIFFLLVRWFFLDLAIDDAVDRKEFTPKIGRIVFMITPVTVVSSKVQKDNANFFSKGKGSTSDLRSLSKSIERPLPLQMLEPEDCFKMIDTLELMNSGSTTFQSRFPLPHDLEENYSYESLSGSKLAKQLKKWAQVTGKKCPDGTKCGNKEFSKCETSELHLGHIISQHCCKALHFDNNFIHHPYNQYLSCYSFNEV